MSRDGWAVRARRWGRALSLLVVGVAMGAGVSAQRRSHEVGPVPAWVVPVAPDLAAEAPAGQVSRGVFPLLSDTQVKVDGADRDTYRHHATRALDAEGVESEANLQITFDPTYQKLVLHLIRVHRGGAVFAKLPAAKVRLLQRETDLDRLIFDGRQTASIVLDDVRVGDVVEYAYSLRGVNPVFAGRHFGTFDMQWGMPVARVHARLLWPVGRPLHLTPHNGAPDASVREGPVHRDLRWDLGPVDGLRLERDTPSWHDPYPAVQWGEFADWAAVVRWAVPLYALAPKPAGAVQAEIDRIAAAHADPGERLMAALRFVQREVRYFGVEAGTGSHLPSRPEVVLARRFGDCKDKALLLLALLRGLDIEAAPALVNTEARRGIAAWQPTPGAFDHVLVRAVVAGRVMWVDPTRAPQQGDATSVVQSDHALALVVGEGVGELAPMAGAEARLRRRHMTHVFDGRAGFDAPVTYTVTTAAGGFEAESMRGTLRSRGLEDLQRAYLNYYAQWYDGLEQLAPMDTRDEASANRIEVTEHYRVTSFWQDDKDKVRRVAKIASPDIDQWLRAPRDPVRRGPLNITHPVDLEVVTEVHLPEPWPSNATHTKVEDPVFTFERDAKTEGTTLRIVERYRSHADHVLPADVARYSANLNKAWQATGHRLTHRPGAKATAGAPRLPPPSGWPHWSVIVVAVLSLGVFGGLAARALRWDPPAAPGAQAWDRPAESFAGRVFVQWVIGTLLGLTGFGLWEMRRYVSGDAWALLTSGEGANPLWAPTLWLAVAGGVGMVVGLGVVSGLTNLRRTSVPTALTLVLVTDVARRWLEVQAFQSLPDVANPGSMHHWRVATICTCLALAAIVVVAQPGMLARTWTRRRGEGPLPRRRPAPAPPDAAPT